MSSAFNATRSNEFSVFNPATGEEVARYPLMSMADVDVVVARARKAFMTWCQTSHEARRSILNKAANVLAENAGRYADEIAAENGKTRFEALLAEVYNVSHSIKYYAKNAEKFLRPVRVPGTMLLPFRKAHYQFEPKGVIGVISPWNYPFSLSAVPVITAIAAGNAVVLKPSSQTTRAGLIVKEILELAGLPPGVVEVATGSGSVTGQALVEHPDLNMIYFTGSTEVGRGVNVAAAKRLIPAVMELGGKDVAIVTRNANLDRAANGIAWTSFTNCGQTCMATEVILVERPVYDTFVNKLVEIVRQLKLGKGSGEVGSLTMESQLRTVMSQLEDAKAKGAKVLIGGEKPTGPGFFFPPTLLADTTPDMKVRTDETFGPLKPVIPFDTIEEALAIANSTEFGLSASVYSQNPEEARSIANGLKTGAVNINEGMMTQAFADLPFGGVKSSGIGRNHGVEGIRAFTDIKSITEYYGSMKREIIWYPTPANGDKIVEQAIGFLFAGGWKRRLRALVEAIGQVRRIPK